MEVFKHECNLGGVEARVFRAEGLNCAEVGEEFTARDVLEDKVKVSVVLCDTL